MNLWGQCRPARREALVELQSGHPTKGRSPRRESRSRVRRTLAFVFTCIKGKLLRSWEKRQRGHRGSATPNSAKCSSHAHHYPGQIHRHPRKQSWSLCRQASRRVHADRNLPGHTSVLCWLHTAAVHLMETKTRCPESPQATEASSTSFPGSIPVKTNTGHDTAQGSCKTQGGDKAAWGPRRGGITMTQIHLHTGHFYLLTANNGCIQRGRNDLGYTGRHRS